VTEKTLARRIYDANMAIDDLEGVLCNCFGDWDYGENKWTADWHDDSIEVYGPGVEDTPKARELLAKAGFRRAWFHPHKKVHDGYGADCPSPPCPCVRLQ
jgi:hypothetical protein